MSDMPDILTQVADVVDNMDKREILARVEAFLDKFPTGLCAFIITNGPMQEMAEIGVASNASLPALDLLLMATRYGIWASQGQNLE